MIDLRDVSFALENKIILNKISLQINEGITSVILGPSGAGKSSILKIILGLWKPDSGEVIIDGHKTGKLSENEMLPIRQKMGMVFQGNALFDSLTVEENIAYFISQKKHLDEIEIRERVEKVLSFVNLSGTEKLYPEELSGGMKKRVAIARALSFWPQIVLFDEPTTGLDPINSKTILELINKLKEIKTTSVVVTHILNDALFIGDKLTVINDGSIVETGTIKDILNSTDKFVNNFFYEVYKDVDLINKHIQ